MPASGRTFMNMWWPTSRACVYACVLGPRPCNNPAGKERGQGCHGEASSLGGNAAAGAWGGEHVATTAGATKTGRS